MNKFTLDQQERIAIIADGCNLTQLEAEAFWLKSQIVSSDHLEVKVQRIRELAKLQQMKRHGKESGKDRAGGD